MCASFLKRAHASLHCTNDAKPFPLWHSYKLLNNLWLVVPARTTPSTKTDHGIQFGTRTATLLLPVPFPSNPASYHDPGNKTLSYPALSVFFRFRVTLLAYDFSSAPPSPPSPPPRHLG